jgi:hypothetical protein
MDDESSWQRQVLIGLTVLVAVGALIGGVVALISIKAADIAGISGDDATTAPTTGRWSKPSDTGATTTSEPTDDAPSTTSAPPTTTEPERTREPDRGITLEANPSSVSTYEPITLTGTYPGGSGETLQVQRWEGGQWVDFPTSATVNGKSYETFVETGRAGKNKFRMKVDGGDESSNTVVVQVS